MRLDTDTDDTVEIPCSACGSYQPECACVVLAEQREAMRGLALHIMEGRAAQGRVDYDGAMAQRALREWGYIR